MDGMAQNVYTNVAILKQTKRKSKEYNIRNACAPEYQIIVRWVLHNTFFFYLFFWLAESPLRREPIISHVEYYMA